MPLDLNAARALHDRDPSDPGVCVTCSTNDRYQAWPCATAHALGATGRSEWDNTDASTTYRNGYPGGDCQQSPNCTGPANHPGHCTTPNDPDNPRCPVTSGSRDETRRCVFNINHTMPHHLVKVAPHADHIVCTTTAPCALEAGHPGGYHRDKNGNML